MAGGCRWLEAGPGSVVARPPAGNIGKSVDGDGRSVGLGMSWVGMAWDAQGDGGYLSAAVRAEWRLVAAGEGVKRRGDGARCSATRLAVAWRGARDGARDGALSETKGMARGDGGVSEAAA